MSRLQCKTKNSTSAQGLARIYFSSHPKDFDDYFEIVCSDIFRTHNCAVYFESDWDAPADFNELEAQLAEMQLFVIPITIRYLFNPNRAILQEFEVAIKHHIPVLPIAMEPEVVTCFQERMNQLSQGYGDIQILNRTSNDITEIPYDDKLKTALSNILNEDEIVKRVRAAFDAYIFLSYRKKDRAYANELMRLIHRIPFCRDTAIWYDEFLSPGEAWNDNIASAIAKSALMVMAVTPNILEPNNFVVEYEYPEARKRGKTIIPVELLETESNNLKKLFPEITDPLNARDENALSTTLKDALNELAVSQTDSPEHNYLIGLAYLDGIDMERNAERGVQMITSAAENDLPEAMNKLASMYQYGDGVDRDYVMEASWRSKLAEHLKILYTNDSTEKNCTLYVSALQKAGDAYNDLNDIKHAQKIYQEIVSVSQKAIDKGVCYEVLFFLLNTLASSYERLGRIAESEVRLSEVQECYSKALAVSKALIDVAPMIKNTDYCLYGNKDVNYKDQARMRLASSYNLLGDYWLSREKNSVAREFYERAIVICENVIAEEETRTALYTLARGYSNLCQLAVAGKQFSVAKHWNGIAMDIFRKIYEQETNSTTLRDLAYCYTVLGDISLAEGNTSMARKSYEDAHTMFSSVAQTVESFGSFRNLALIYGRLGDIALADRDFKSAYDLYEREHSQYFAIYEDLHTAEAVNRLAKTQEKMEAVRNLLACNEDPDNLASTKMISTLSREYELLGNIAEEEGIIFVANVWYLKALELRKHLAEELRSMDSYHNLAWAFLRLGNIEKANHNYTQAKVWYEEALATILSSVEKFHDSTISLDLFVIRGKLQALLLSNA